MKTIGIAAVTAEGAADCYKKIVQLSAKRLGPNKHPEIILVNPSFDSILAAQKQRDWEVVAKILSEAARKAVNGGAEFIIMPANSVHFAYDLVAKQLNVPLLNLVEIVVDACSQEGYKKVSVLGVGLTMSDGLYNKEFAKQSIENITIANNEAIELDRIIYEELVQGKVNQKSVSSIFEICERLKEAGCQAVILACTELQSIFTNGKSPLPVLDSTELLAKAAVEYSVGPKE